MLQPLLNEKQQRKQFGIFSLTNLLLLAFCMLGLLFTTLVIRSVPQLEWRVAEPSDDDEVKSERKLGVWILGHGETEDFKHTPFTSNLLRLDKEEGFDHLHESGTYIGGHGWASKAGHIPENKLHDGNWIKSEYKPTHGRGDPEGIVVKEDVREKRFEPRAEYIPTHGRADSAGKLYNGMFMRPEFHSGEWRFGTGFKGFHGEDATAQEILVTHTKDAVFGPCHELNDNKPWRRRLVEEADPNTYITTTSTTATAAPEREVQDKPPSSSSPPKSNSPPPPPANPNAKPPPLPRDNPSPPKPNGPNETPPLPPATESQMGRRKGSVPNSQSWPADPKKKQDPPPTKKNTKTGTMGVHNDYCG